MKILDYIKEIWSVVTGDLEDIYLYELLTRKATDKESYLRWLHTLEKEQMLSYIFQEFRLSQMEKEDRNMIRFFKTKHTIGFMLRYPETMMPLHFQHLFDHLKEKTEENGYFITTSDRKIYSRKGYEEIIERYHFQPTPTAFDNNGFTSQEITGIFDTISLELYKVENQPMYLKMICRNTKEKTGKSISFKNLINRICNQDEFMEEAASHLHSSENGNLL